MTGEAHRHVSRGASDRSKACEQGPVGGVLVGLRRE